MAVDAVALRRGLARLGTALDNLERDVALGLAALLAAGLAADRVVADDQRVAVQQHRLEPAVGARHQTGLLAEEREVEHHRAGHAGHDQERDRVIERRPCDPCPQLVHAHEVGQKRVRQEHAQEQIRRELGRPSPGSGLLLLARLALEQPLDGAVEELHVHCLRARPAAPHAPEERREQEDRDEDADREQRQQHGVGRIEDRPEQRELATRDVELHQRASGEAQVGDQREQRDQCVRHNPPSVPELSARRLGLDPPTRPVRVQRREHARLGCLHRTHPRTAPSPTEDAAHLQDRPALRRVTRPRAARRPARRASAHPRAGGRPACSCRGAR